MFGFDNGGTDARTALVQQLLQQFQNNLSSKQSIGRTIPGFKQLPMPYGPGGLPIGAFQGALGGINRAQGGRAPGGPPGTANAPAMLSGALPVTPSAGGAPSGSTPSATAVMPGAPAGGTGQTPGPGPSPVQGPTGSIFPDVGGPQSAPIGPGQGGGGMASPVGPPLPPVTGVGPPQPPMGNVGPPQHAAPYIGPPKPQTSLTVPNLKGFGPGTVTSSYGLGAGGQPQHFLPQQASILGAPSNDSHLVPLGGGMYYDPLTDSIRGRGR